MNEVGWAGWVVCVCVWGGVGEGLAWVMEERDKLLP